ncbi:MAG: DciA family protein [Holophaga sp.]|nr:DciA family protein [Holophaga sp.]
MRRQGSGGLVPLSAMGRGPDRAAQAEARVEARIQRSWLLVVGPTLVHQTRLLRVHRGILLVGCWHPEIIPSLRQSAESIWPQLRDRLDRLWKLKLQRMEIVPCDPPVLEAPVRAAKADPLEAVLNLLREQGKGGWTRRTG